MTTPKLISFDCYGTLIDWEAGILSALKPVLARHDCHISDTEILRHYARIESTLEAGPYQSYCSILRGITEQLGLDLGFTPAADELDALPRSLADWQPFSDTVSALAALKSRYPLAIISNIDDDLFAATARNLHVAFDFVITAQQVQSYNPSVL